MRRRSKKVIETMKSVKRNTPNSLTLLNLLSGVMAIICAFHGLEPWWGLQGWQWAAIFIGTSAVADFFDGFMARLLGAYSELGKELDSLSDLVSFGVAPSLLAFNVLHGMEPGVLPWMKWCMLVVPLVAAVRLGRFNLDTRQTTYFIGMPVPANAIFWIGFSALVTQEASFLTLIPVFVPVLLLETWLMVSPLRLLSLKFHDYAFSGMNVWRYSLLVALAVLVFCMGVAGLMWFIVFYVLLSLSIKIR